MEILVPIKLDLGHVRLFWPMMDYDEARLGAIFILSLATRTSSRGYAMLAVFPSSSSLHRPVLSMAPRDPDEMCHQRCPETISMCQADLVQRYARKVARWLAVSIELRRLLGAATVTIFWTV